jgi:hypothetical protein
MRANNEHFKMTGKSLTPQQVLDSLLAEVAPRAAKLRGEARPVEQPIQQPAQPKPAQAPAKTLSTRDGGASTADRPDPMTLDWETRKKRATEALMFEDDGQKK